MAKQLNIGNTTSPVDVNITESLKINGKTAIVSSSESLGESTRPLYLENGELLAGSQQYTFWENDTSDNVIVQTAGNYLLKTGDTMTGLLSTQNVNPSADNTYSLGNSTYRYNNIFTNTLTTSEINGSILFKYNNTWLSPSIIQLGRYDSSTISGKAVIGVTDGNLHLDAYPGKGIYFNWYGGGDIQSGGKLYGAVWNDYAEYRASDEVEPGRVVLEDENGRCQKVDKRLQSFAGVVSDTFGFAQGQTDTAKTPLAVAGRVLVYPYQDRKNYHVGDCVCTAPNGTVDIMTHEEEKEWPSRIVGTVSEIPKYETWGTGNVPVNGRIWIKVR